MAVARDDSPQSAPSGHRRGLEHTDGLAPDALEPDLASEDGVEVEQATVGEGPTARPGERIVLRPTPSAVGATLLLVLIFVVVLQFLVVISFVGQKLWADPALFRDHVHTLPVYVWMAVVALSVVAVLRIATQRVRLSAWGVRVRGLFRIPRSASWDEIAGVWMVRDIVRGKTPPNPVEHDLEAQDACVIMAKNHVRIANVSGMLYGPRAQAAVVGTAQKIGLPVELIDHARAHEFDERVPGSQTFLERRPGLVAAVIVLLFLADNVMTFFVWGL